MIPGALSPCSLREAMFNAMYLWGSHFSTDPLLRSREAELLVQAVHSVSGSLFIDSTAQRGQAVTYGIQAEILLANFYLANGRFLEGRYHVSAAVSLAVSCKLNLVHNGLSTSTSNIIYVLFLFVLRLLGRSFGLDRSWREVRCLLAGVYFR